MFKIIFCAFLVGLNSLILSSQHKTIALESERNDNKTITISYNKTDPGSFLVQLEFDGLAGTSSDFILKKTISGYSGEFTTLQPIDDQSSIRFSGYSYKYRRGAYKSKVAKDFEYVLPYLPDVSATVRNLNNVGDTYLGQDHKGDWKAFQFLFKKETTVTAIRKGVVVEITDKYDDYKEGTSYSSKSNKVLIEHADGTLASYGVLKKGGMEVEVGDTVYPNTPIGISGAYKADRYELRLLVYFLKNDKFPKERTNKKEEQHIFSSYIDPIFVHLEGSGKLIPKNTYTSFAKPEIIQKEMRKRELKRLAKNK